jgi:hypothetical protein
MIILSDISCVEVIFDDMMMISARCVLEQQAELGFFSYSSMHNSPPVERSITKDTLF